MGTVAAQPERAPTRNCDETGLIGIVERAMHSSASEWLFFRELRVGTARENGGAQRLDAFALNTLPHMAMKRVCYEIKTSRADFLSELKRPLKRRIGLRYSNEFYFVTPAALVEVGEIPSECGLVEAGFAAFEEWRGLAGRHAGFFNYDPETQGILHHQSAGTVARYPGTNLAACRGDAPESAAAILGAAAGTPASGAARAPVRARSGIG